MWVVLQGKYLFNVTFAGKPADPSRLRDPLKRLTTDAPAAPDDARRREPLPSRRLATRSPCAVR